MSADFVARLIGMIVFSILGVSGHIPGELANINPGELLPFSALSSMLLPLAWLAH
jgi:hypothetical protein